MQDTQRYFLDLISRERGEFQKTLNGLDTAEKKKLLLEPLSEQVRENTLSYIVADRYSGNNHKWRGPFLTTALNAIEKLGIPAAERLALLTSANELGQTLFHTALKHDVKKRDGKKLFSLLEKRLRKWGGNEYADAFMQSFLNEPLGTIDEKVSVALQTIRHNFFPYGSEDRDRIEILCGNNYQPATYKGLKSTIDKVRPLIQQWAEKNSGEQSNPRLAPAIARAKLLKEFAQNAEAVTAKPLKLGDYGIGPKIAP
jgi:hypothetical protein